MTTPTPPGYIPPPVYSPVPQRTQPLIYTAPKGIYQWTVNHVPYGARNVDVPKGMPRFLAERPVLFGAWAIAMATISYDEWHNYSRLPIPKRLWETTLVYGLLAVVSTVDFMVPLTNAFGIGYAIMLMYQYYNSEGQFTGSGSKGAS